MLFLKIRDTSHENCLSGRDVVTYSTLLLQENFPFRKEQPEQSESNKRY